ncbi:Dihydrolipoyl dehydrogenase [Serratia quinivorans]|nr:Dihydrolipoyl dehydrogenase [Serratia quinivorans]CAI2012851.1 Dihydrolipoyl dehydrogenase [Serratia quinivorans]
MLTSPLSVALHRLGVETKVFGVGGAVGRRPNVNNLGLKNTGLLLDVRQADRLTMQTSVPHIFIAGDASNQLPLLHEASDQARIAGTFTRDAT